jgi:hypothetical protein
MPKILLSFIMLMQRRFFLTLLFFRIIYTLYTVWPLTRGILCPTRTQASRFNTPLLELLQNGKNIYIFSLLLDATSSHLVYRCRAFIIIIRRTILRLFFVPFSSLANFRFKFVDNFFSDFKLFYNFWQLFGNFLTTFWQLFDIIFDLFFVNFMSNLDFLFFLSSCFFRKWVS